MSGVFYYYCPLDFLRQGRSLNLKLTSLAGRTPSVCLSLPLQYRDYRYIPPCPASYYYKDAGDWVWVPTLTQHGLY